MNKILLFFGLTLLSACATSTDVRTERVHDLDGATVRKIVKPSMGSGVILAFVEIEVVKKNKPTVLLYLYGDDSQRIPAAGDRCSFHYEVEAVEGVVGTTFAKKQSANVLKKYECTPE